VLRVVAGSRLAVSTLTSRYPRWHISCAHTSMYVQSNSNLDSRRSPWEHNSWNVASSGGQMRHEELQLVCPLRASSSACASLGLEADYFTMMLLLKRFCSAALIRRPMVTQSVTAAVLFGAGDIVAQQAIEGKGKNHDVRSYFLLRLKHI
jgi:hypothetical protein